MAAKRYTCKLLLSSEELDQMKDILKRHGLSHCIQDITCNRTQKQPPKVKSKRCGEDQGSAAPKVPKTDESKATTEKRCPYCFMRPCIAIVNENATFVGRGNFMPSINNPPIRHQIYKRFWNVINNMGGWHIPDYIEKKTQIGGGDDIINHPREIMPECVLTLVRRKYPNPKGVPYMDHKWD